MFEKENKMKDLNERQANALDIMSNAAFSQKCKKDAKRVMFKFKQCHNYRDDIIITKYINAKLINDLNGLGLIAYGKHSKAWGITTKGEEAVTKLSWWRIPNLEWQGPGWYYRIEVPVSSGNKALWEHAIQRGSDNFSAPDQVMDFSKKPIYLKKQSFLRIGQLHEYGEVILDHVPHGYDQDGYENGYDDISVVLLNSLLWVKHFVQNPTGQGYVHGYGSVYRKPDYKSSTELLKSDDPANYYYKNIHYKFPADEDLSDPEFV